MLNSTKTWQEEFDEQFIDVIVFDSNGSYYKKFKEGVELINIYKFISDLRKRDMEALIKMLPKDDNSETFLYRNRVKKIIQDYYEN